MQCERIAKHGFCQVSTKIILVETVEHCDEKSGLSIGEISDFQSETLDSSSDQIAQELTKPAEKTLEYGFGGECPMRQIRTLWIASLLVIASALTACKTESNYFVDENASGGGGTDNGAPTTATGLRVRLKAKAGVDSFLHKFGDVNSPCEISKTDVDTPTDMYCMLNMMEYDVWFHGFEYEINVPEGFCSYIEERPYRYFWMPPGRVPERATLEVTDGVITDCTVDGAPALDVRPAYCDTGEGLILADGTFRCAYDYSATTGYPNCCTGQMALTVTTILSNPAPGTINTSTGIVSGGGDANSCVDGPHRYAERWPLFVNGQPATNYLNLGSASYTRTQKIPSEFDVRERRAITKGNVFLSGFHEWAQYAADPATWPATRTVPRMFTPVNDLGPNGDYSSGSLIASLGDGSYQFSCLGPAGELRHRVRLYLNEWNTIEDYTAFKADGDPTAVNPNRTGVTGVDCAAINTGGSCNSFWGVDDLIDAYGASDPGAYVFPGDYWLLEPN